MNTREEQTRRRGKVSIAVGAAIVLAIIAAAVASAATKGTAAHVTLQEAPVAKPVAPKKQPPKAKQRSNKATDHYEPHVKPRGSVVVDTQKWRIVSARTKRRIGNRFLSEKADGLYVIVKLRVRNDKDRSVTLTSSQMTYEAAGKEYSTDSDGSTALTITSDEETFFLKDLGPDVATTGVATFDVPRATLKRKPEICFRDLTVGWKKGCIRLPRPTARHAAR